MAPKDEASYIPRTDLGFTDRRKSTRLNLSFTDELEAEDWDRSDKFEQLAVALRDRELG